MGRIAVAAIVSLWVVPISIMVNRIVSDPYMDEIFHIPQAQQYCRGNFKSWDPMITTPPGLYCISLLHVAYLFPAFWCTKAVSSLSGLCSTAILRATNGALAVICSILVYDILIHLRPSLGERKATLYSVILALYPLHWFFTFLYYTDVASVTAVLAMYLACLKGHYLSSALLGGLAILIRQTNVIWMLFVAGVGVINYTEILTAKNYAKLGGPSIATGRNAGLTNNKNLEVAPNLRKRKMTSSVSFLGVSVSEMTSHSSIHASGLIEELQDLFLSVWSFKWKILACFTPFLVVLVAFVSFVIWNGSVVLGAKEAHTVSPHFAQLMYFGLVSAAAMAPVHFSLDQAALVCRSMWKNNLKGFLQVIMVLAAGFISVHFFSIAHPYLLADNRHYPFYIWRKVIMAHWSMKYLLVPLYTFSWLSIFSILGKVQKKIWLLLFSFACAAVLIPTPLIEFRYYTIPFYFMILHSLIDDNRSWFLMGVLYIAVNIFTMIMFLNRPFHWDHVPGIQRFMW